MARNRYASLVYVAEPCALVCQVTVSHHFVSRSENAVTWPTGKGGTKAVLNSTTTAEAEDRYDSSAITRYAPATQ
jgi:hypothetical protein